MSEYLKSDLLFSRMFHLK